MPTHFAPSGPLRGRIRPPADKSISHRAALIAGMCDSPVTIRNYLDSADTNSTLNAVRLLGGAVEHRGGTVLVRGVGVRGAQQFNGIVDVGNSGTLIRLLPGWLCGQPAGRWQLDGDESIRRRPMRRIVDSLREMGAVIEASDQGTPPLTIEAAPLHGIDYTLPVASAQVKSCLLLAAMAASGTTRIREPQVTRDHTERMLVAAGLPLRREGDTIVVDGLIDELELSTIDVPGDLSSAAFMIVAGVLIKGSRLVIEDVGLNHTRIGILNILERMGAVVLADPERPSREIPSHEPTGDLDVAAAPLVGTTVGGDEVPLAIDELPLVALLGCFAEGETVVTGARELRFKESDRITAVVNGLRGLGAEIEDVGDGFVVQGTDGLRGGTIDSHGDHRLAMLGAIAGLASDEGVDVINMRAAAVSYPNFQHDLERLGR
ncbi:MAG: 3-phosphoshikimate 1-carboxyvinyltransferase [Thermoleophilia bacterium]|nr:3-phosphoshikimate 1-carboxyvinyltransferase [Thermoleophilia bacterium]